MRQPLSQASPRALLVLVLSGSLMAPAAAQAPAPSSWDPLTGPRSRLARDWVGTRPLPADAEILVMPGHADSQQVGGPGTSGEAVARRGAAPMQTGISDELHWNLLTAQAVVRLGQRRGLPIRYYDPPERSIPDSDNPRTTWSVGRAHAAAGGYALEIHYDAYGPDGIGSGVIIPTDRPPSRVDESLAQEFGSYPRRFRGELGAPRRGIAILEIGKLEGPLEQALRDPERSAATLNAIAERVVRALAQGLGRPPSWPGETAGSAQPAALVSSPPDGGRSAPPAPRPQASAGGG